MSDPGDDIVGVGGDLRPDTLLHAYRRGIFPWPHGDLPLPWFCPARRAVLDFIDLHLGRSLTRARQRSTLRFSLDVAFPDVIRACAQAHRPGQEGTWIHPGMIDAYIRLHELGFAHSAEAWHGERLVGGVYGVDPGGAFSAESMFYRESDASRLALLHLIDHLASRGLDWIDVQVMTPHVERMGAREIPRAEFLRRLAGALRGGLRLFG